MNLVTNRSVSNVMLQNSGSQYTAADLNRVESAVRCLLFVAKDILPERLELQTKTDWDIPGIFSASSWNVLSQMDRYLSNVKSLCTAVGIQVPLPSSMRFLTANGANQIEKALELARSEIGKNIKTYQYSGEIYSGEEFCL